MILETGTIVIINTEDGVRGKIRAPGIIRYHDEPHDAYEVNVFAPRNLEGCGGHEDVWWWIVSDNEIEAVLGKAKTTKED